jgi:hypothetical protein
MAFVCEVDRQQRLGVAQVTGTVDVDQLLQIIHTLLDDPDWEPGYDVLWDGRRITEFFVSEDEMAKVAATGRGRMEQVGGGKTAFVVEPGKVEDLTRLYASLAADPRRERRIFADVPEALDWLGKTSPE